MRILLLGANGQVGRELRRSLAPLGDVVAATRDGVLAGDGPDDVGCEIADFNTPESLPGLIVRIEPDVVVNAAAYTAVDRAEDEPDAAYRVNAEAPRVIAEACGAHGVRLVHYSTDYVFDGSATRAYREDDPTAPLGVYGASKLAGEQAIQASGARHLILRTAWVYSAHGRNFLKTILRLASENETLRIVDDQHGSPTPAALIADTTASALTRQIQASGLWHLACRGQTTWHGFAQVIVERAFTLGIITRMPSVESVATADYPTKARRPGYSRLDVGKIERDFGLVMPNWHDVISKELP